CNNKNNMNTMKHQVWQTLLPNLQIKQVDGIRQRMLEPPTIDLTIEQLKLINIL
ncbi:unnamed protein product, partial [Rotaria sp. Silwood2]